MERVYAFTDEYASTAEKLRQKYFQKGEIKSKNVGTNHKRRRAIINEMQNMPFSVFAVCIDKKHAWKT